MTDKSTFLHTWFEDGEFGDVILRCKCGTDTEIGIVDSYYDILECKNCGRKYRIVMKICLEEIKEKERKELNKIPKYLESLKTDGDNLLKDLESQEDEYSPCKEAEKKIVGKKKEDYRIVITIKATLEKYKNKKWIAEGKPIGVLQTLSQDAFLVLNREVILDHLTEGMRNLFNTMIKEFKPIMEE